TDGGVAEIDVNCSRLGRSQGGLFLDDIFAFGGTVYWLNGSELRSGVVANNASGTFDLAAAALNGNAFTAFAIDGTTTVYLAETGLRNCATWKDPDAKTQCLVYGPATAALVQKAPVGNDATVVPLARIVDPQDATQVLGATSVAVDGTKVYYATE